MRFRIPLCCAVLLAGLALAGAASAKVLEQAVDYSHEAVALQGFLAWDDAWTGPRPAVVVFHDWSGLGEQPRETCRRLAALGWLALAPDMYGKGVLAKDSAEAGRLAGAFRAGSDRHAMRRRAAEGLRQALQHPLCDHKKVAAMGYCFGGGVALELARSGAPLVGVLAVHASLATPHPGDAKNVMCPILALHGADDPLVPPAEVEGFMREMTAAGADWRLIHFSGAAHAFTNPKAGSDKAKGAAYDARADRRAWRYSVDFFKEVFGQP